MRISSPPTVGPCRYGIDTPTREELIASHKSIVEIRLVERQPTTTWSAAAPNEYGFFANVNPAVDHPRWSQATERRIGELHRRPTLPFNGYGAEVAHLYAGMDLATYF